MSSAMPRALLLLAAATLPGLAGPARAVETWVDADGQIHVVRGTEDPTAGRLSLERPVPRSFTPPTTAEPLAARVPDAAGIGDARDHPRAAHTPAHRPATPPVHAAAPARHEPAPARAKITATRPPTQRSHVARSTAARPETVDPIRTGAIRRQSADSPDQANDPQQPMPRPIPRPATPLYDASQQPTPAQAPVTDPGNARILVDPSTDTMERTAEPDGDFSASIDTTLTPDAAAASLYPTTPQAASPAPQVPGTTQRAPLRGTSPLASPIPTMGTLAPATAETATRMTADGLDPVPATANTPVRSLSQPQPQPAVAVAPQPTTGTTGAIATMPRLATAPNPRIGTDDPLTDPQATAYDQVGIQRGPFIWKPAVESSIGATSNIQGAANGTASSALRIAPELIGQSNWSRHQLGVELRGTFTDYPADWSLYRPTIAANVNGRIDFTDDSKLTLKAGYGLDKLPSTSALNAAGTTAAGLQSTYTGSAAFTRDMGLFAMTLRGDATRTTYALSAAQAAATSAAGLDNTVFTGALRGTYNMSASIKPFLEVQSDARRYDALSQDSTTSAPTSHDSSGMALRSGLTLDLGPILSGESAIGAGYERPVNTSLKTVSAFTFDENLVWAPTRLTKVTFSAVSAIEPSLIAGASGAVSRTLGVKLSNDIRRNVTIDLGGTFLYRTYTGLYRTENLGEITSGVTWKITPTLQTFVRGTFDAFHSSAHTDDFTAATVFAGVRLQR